MTCKFKSTAQTTDETYCSASLISILDSSCISQTSHIQNRTHQGQSFCSKTEFDSESRNTWPRCLFFCLTSILCKCGKGSVFRITLKSKQHMQMKLSEPRLTSEMLCKSVTIFLMKEHEAGAQLKGLDYLHSVREALGSISTTIGEI